MKDWRIIFVFLLIVAAALGIAGRLFYVQIHQGGYYKALARGQNTAYITRDPVRGDIFFQDNFNKESGLYLAATNKDWPLLYAVPQEIQDPQFAADHLAPVVGMETQDISEKLKDPQDPYEPLAHRLDKMQVEEIEYMDILGIYIKPEPFTNY